VSYASGAIRAFPYREAGQISKENMREVEREEIFTQFVKNLSQKTEKCLFETIQVLFFIH
jgi:hypothetical protein